MSKKLNKQNSEHIESKVFRRAITFDQVVTLKEIKFKNPSLQVLKLPPGVFMQKQKLKLFYHHP